MQTEKTGIAVSLWFVRVVLFFCLINIQHKFCSNVPEIFLLFISFILFSASFKVLESLFSALNIWFLPLITNFSPLPARVFHFSNRCDIIRYSEMWITIYAKDIIISADLQKKSNDLIAINGWCWDKSLKCKSSESTAGMNQTKARHHSILLKWPEMRMCLSSHIFVNLCCC